MSKHEHRGRAPRDLPRIPILHLPDNGASFSFIQESKWGLPDPNAQLAALLEMPRDELHEASAILTYLLTQAGLLERLLDVAIAVLDVREGEIDLEDNNDQEGIDEREEDNSDREPDDEDTDEYCDDEEDDDAGCEAGDDIGTSGPLARRFFHPARLGAGAGDPTDDTELNGDEGDSSMSGPEPQHH